MKPFCAITTPAIEKIAKELGRPAKLVTNAVSIIQTRKQSMEEPTKEEIQQFFSERRPQVNGVQVNQNDDFAALARDYTPRQQQDRAVAIARIFSDIVSRKVEEKIDELNTALNEAHLNNNLTQIEDITSDLQLFNSDKGRQIIIQEETLQGIFKEMKNTFQSEVSNDQNDEYVRNEYQKLVNNFDALLENACTIIEGVENIRIIPDKHTYHRNNESTEVVTGGTIVQTPQDEDIEEQEFEDDEEGTRVTGNDGWSFQVRFIDPYTSLSKNVKRILSNIIRVDAEGNEEFDDLGNLRYLNPEYAHTALLNIMSSIVDIEDFNVKDGDGNYSFPILERAQARYPWISQVIAELESNPDLVGSFYADLRKDFIPYSHQYEYTTEEGNTYTVTHYLNQNTATESSFNRIEANYEQGTILDVDSIYKQNGNIDSEKSSIGIETVDEVLSLLRDFDEDDYDEITTKAAKVLRMVGVDINKHAISNILKSNNGIQDIESVLNSAKYIFQGLDEISDETNLLDQFQESYKNIASKVGVVDELDNIASFRQDSKTRYSYSAPNYIESLLKRFRYEDEAKRNQFLEEEFGRYEWFRKDGKWRSEWLRLLAEDENVRFQLASKELISLSGKEYTDWKANDIKYAFVTEYFSIPVNEKAQHQYAWYNMPIFSDSPVVKFIKGVRYTGDYKRKLLPLFREVVKQEIDRIKLVEQRRINHAASIQNFDTNGDRFHFFPELNSGNLRDEALSLHGTELDSWIDEHVEMILDSLYGDFIKNAPINAISQNLKASGIIKGTTDAEINTATQKALEEYFWNQAYATTQIIELTTTDLAFYKDDTDFQKRYKEVYAAGTKLNTLSKYGKETRKSLYLIDQIITSGEYTNIKKSLDKAVELGHIQSFDRDNILNKFKDINVADAQAYVSPKSMRSILDMMGAWTDEMETSFQRFERGEWDMSDFNTIWQTIKPFVYTQLSKPDGLGGIMKVPHQNKNSEFLLLAAYNMIANAEASPKLRALQRFMSDNDIDVIQFESAVKAGGQGRIDLNYSPSRLEAAYRKYVSEEGPARIDEFKESLDYALDKGEITQEEYNKRFKEIEPTEQEVYNTLYQNAFPDGNPNNPNPEVVHEIPYRDYVIQQPTPEHLLDTEAVFGSQLRNLIIADLPEDIEIEVNGKKLNRQQILDLYQACIVENLLEDYSKVSGRFTDIHRLQEALLNQVKGNVKFSRDMVNALQIVEVTNPYTGEKEEVFNLPLNNPNTTVRLQELVTSMFKNAVTKQHIKGGACILVSNWGMTDELQVRHDPKTGKVTGIECYLPAYSKQFYEPFMVTKTENGVTYQELDIKKLQEAGLDKLVGYRIPTEDKYSMAPLIVKGFLPQQNGSSIMLPADITQIAGSDFDIDKMFLMIPEFRTLNYNYTQAKQDYQAIISDDAVTKLLSSIFQDNTDLEDAMNEAPNDFKEWFEENKEKYRYETPRVVKVKYDTTKTPQKNSRAARNNMLIDIIHGILTNPDTAEKIHNPGNFDKAKLQARITEIITDRNILSEFQEYFNLGDDLDLTILTILDISERGQLKKVDKFLKDYKKKYNTTRSQLTIDTFCYNHTQNMTGGALIGMYANNTTMQAKYQHSNLAIKDNLNFFINGRRIQSLHDTISGLGERISSNCAQFSAASVDNVKDPVLAKLLQNTNTANITGFMLRAGMSIEEISLMFAQPLVRQCILDTGSLDNLEDYALAYQESTGITFSQEYLLHEYTSEELLRNVLTNNPNQQQNIIDATYLMMHIVELSKTLSELTQISRADSPNGAISNSIGGAKLQVSAVKRYMDQSKGKKFPFTGLEDAMQYHYVDVTTSKDGMRTKFLNKKMPMLQAFYSLGIELGTSIIGNYFQQINAYSDDLLETILDTAPNFVVQNKKVGTKVIETFYKDLVQFGLTKTKLFGDDEKETFEEKRDYYLKEFPKKYLQILEANPEIKKLGLFKKIGVKNGRIILARSARMRQNAKDTLMRDMDTLLYMGPEAQELARDLFMYAFYENGFSFGPNSFGNFFSTNFINAFPEVVTALRNMKAEMKKGTYFDEFLPQFYANHSNDLVLTNIVNIDRIKLKEGEQILIGDEGQIFLPSRLVFNSNTLKYDFKYIRINTERSDIPSGLYVMTSYGDNNVCYVKAPEFQTQKYNANMTATEMLDYDETPTITDNLADPFAGMYSDEDMYDMQNDFNKYDEYDKYDESTSQSQLDNPMCK
jgi:hypothetical protein